MTDNLSQDLPPSFNPESSRADEVSVHYKQLLYEIDDNLPPNHEIAYIPYDSKLALDNPQNIKYVKPEELPKIIADTDVIICISRDEDINPDYTDQYPDRNIVLTPSGGSNVDKSVELFKIAREAGNEHIKFISTGRMHNRAIRMMLALPLIAEFIGINAEDVYHIPEARFKELLDSTFTPEIINKLNLKDESGELAANYKALNELLDGAEAASSIFQEYQRYPRISTSRLMVERAIQGGIPPEAIYEEDGAVDTISNLINVTQMMLTSDDFRGCDIKKVVFVAGSDHMPRTMWIADHILPDGINIVCVEADPKLDSASYAASCDRELLSFNKGSKWIGETRDLEELDEIVEAGYFSKERKTAEQIAREVAMQSIGSTTLKQ